MAHTLQSDHSILTSVKDKTIKLVSAANEYLAHRAKRKQSIKELSALSNRELNDIGLCRGDIWNVVNDNFYAESIRTRVDSEMKILGPNNNIKGDT